MTKFEWDPIFTYQISKDKHLILFYANKDIGKEALPSIVSGV